jgi:thiamine biosynthesis lipoprotein
MMIMQRSILWTGTLALTVILNGCIPGDSGAWLKISGYTQGTTYNVTYQDPDSTDYREQLEALLREFDLSLSTYVPNSIISRMNRGMPDVVADDYFRNCFLAAAEVHAATGGAFDITVAPVVNAWGFGFTERSRVDSALIDSLLQFVGMDKVTLRDNRLVKESEGVMLDMNAIAQGYAVDVLAGFFDDEKIRNYLIEIGGEVRTSGKNRFGLDWRIGIDKPIDGLQVPGVQMQAIVQISGRSLATSGNYRRFYEEDGIKYSHTIDPFTGYPVQHGLLSATVVAEDCMRADAYATAFMVMGYEKARRFLEKHSELDAYLIFNDEMGEYRVWYTPGMGKILSEEF